MKTISELYQQEGAPFLNRLHQLTGANKKYLYHIAVGLRRPSPEMALRLCMADNRLSFERLLLPEWPEGVSRPVVAGGGGGDVDSNEAVVAMAAAGVDEICRAVGRRQGRGARQSGQRREAKEKEGNE